MSDWIERYHGSHPQKGWTIVGGGEEIVYLGESVSSEQVSKIVVAHNARVHDLSADNAIAPTQGADARPVPNDKPSWNDALFARVTDWVNAHGIPFEAQNELFHILAASTTWEALFDRVALQLNCLPSASVDGNEHVFHAIEKLRGTTTQPVQTERALTDSVRYQRFRRWHPRLQTSYWTGQWWEPIYGEKMDACIDSLDEVPQPTPHADQKGAAQPASDADPK